MIAVKLGYIIILLLVIMTQEQKELQLPLFDNLCRLFEVSSDVFFPADIHYIREPMLSIIDG
jgi:hypothetical protein